MMPNTARKGVVAAGLVIGCLSLGGCLGPTYGTGKSQGETLFDDMNNFVSLGDSDGKAKIAYTPRPELVKPENTAVLPQPQVARNTTGDPDWPESPEERSKRIQAAAYQGDGPLPAEFATKRKEGVTQDYLDRTSGGGSYSFGKNSDEAGVLSPSEMKSRSEMLQARLKERNQGSPDQRRYLSEPPLTYRKPADSAPVGDPGEDEEVKERRLRGTGPGLLDKLGDLLPF
ncbi:hypothetical protein E3C22_20040 [Jiella endophytica]|uniref:DUF3035 domain-containing protein n=1 Tax=Jiella endophytica TaxID=2558362 RepID=A0A4Y8RCU1_9HYPH|nr:hypothetical protein [Jiella endophytica]TFF19070.1 hypothetical protein E3C22_20040 [Jiella endophytica]